MGNGRPEADLDADGQHKRVSGFHGDEFDADAEIEQIAAERERFAPSVGEQISRMLNAGAVE